MKKVKIKQKRSHHGESPIKKQWRTRLEATPLRYEQHTDCMTN